jgi:hypothetical protein
LENDEFLAVTEVWLIKRNSKINAFNHRGAKYKLRSKQKMAIRFAPKHSTSSVTRHPIKVATPARARLINKGINIIFDSIGSTEN